MSVEGGDFPVRHIELSQGYQALVDASDCDWLTAGPKWCACVIRRRGRILGVYAVREIRPTSNQRTRQQMHRLLLPGVRIVDHIDGDGLNNTRANLRDGSDGKNNVNRRLYGNSSSGFKGVHFHKARARWHARIRLNNVRKSLGYYDTAIEAAVAYDNAARELHGEYARLNFPVAGEQAA